MNDNDIQEQLNAQQQALAKIYKSVEKTRKYILWSGIGSLVIFVLPLIIAVVMLPRIIGTLTGGINMLEQGSSISQTVSVEKLSETLEGLKGFGL